MLRRRLPILYFAAQLRQQVQQWRRKGNTVALVPTMGSLHEGHLSLVRLAKRRADKVVVSVFVNPAQFAPHEDFDSYPRNEERDWVKLSSAEADVMYAPTMSEMYPENFSTRVEVAGITRTLEGVSRPHFFAGVTTVVAKLLLQCLPDVAVFGEKDYQQLLVVRRMVEDLNFPTSIVGAPVVRESDGLAMSSRNAYLSAAERAVAPKLYAAIEAVAIDLAKGRQVSEAVAEGRSRLEKAGFRLDYLEVRDADTLAPIDGFLESPARVLVAAWLGTTRLIDNVAAAPDSI